MTTIHILRTLKGLIDRALDEENLKERNEIHVTNNILERLHEIEEKLGYNK